MEKYVNYITILPEAIISLVAVVLMLVDAYTGGGRRKLYAWISLGGFAAAGASLGWIAVLVSTNSASAPVSTYMGMLTTDPFRIAFSTIALVVSTLTVLAAISWLDEDSLPAGEFYTLLMFATVGMLLMASAGDLVMIFLGLEILSIATYVLAGYRRRDLRSNEAGIKYYILGSFATAFLLYGMALTYGATRTTNLEGIRLAISGGKVDWTWLLLVGGGMMLVGLCFKISAAPFHVWTPDVYEGAPTPVTAFISVGPKVAAYAILAGSSTWRFARIHADWGLVLALVSAATMILGNVAALLQTTSSACSRTRRSPTRGTRCSASWASRRSGGCGGS